MRIVVGVLVAVLVVAGAAALLRDDTPAEFKAGPTDAESSAPQSIVDACAPGCVATPVPATPCPYCDQDGSAWMDLTSTSPPELLGTSAVLIEGDCGEVLYGLHARERRQPASLIKIVTAMTAIEHAELDEIVDITVTGWDLSVENGSSIMGLQEGMRLTVEELLYGLLLPSGNDAAMQIAEHLGGTERLVSLMNERIHALGLTDTHAANGHGLDAPDAYSTPFDMAVLGRELLQNPVLETMVDTQFRPAAWHDLDGLWNGNYLLYVYEDAIGIKTGYTEGAGWSIVSAAERDGRLLIASVFDSSDVYWDSMRLFDWAFENTTSAC